jgi:23S rRNA (adenine2503-C2)-methyltransferase
MGSRSLCDLTYSGMETVLREDGVHPIHAGALWRALYHDLDEAPQQREDFPPPLRRWLGRVWGTSWGLTTAETIERTQSTDGNTRKLLVRLGDGQEVETVVMGYPGRFTACLSSQAGCAMGCVFCATGQMGFVRNLSAGEILMQIFRAQQLLRQTGAKLRNLVLMGMGEPFANYDAVMQALDVAAHTPGWGIGPSRVSVSTVGVVPGIIRFADERRPQGLAVSLHAATDAERSALLPVNQRWPLADLMGALRYYCGKSGERVFIGWTLIAGRNDSLEQARVLSELLRGVNAHVNLIPLNATRGFAGQSPAWSAAEAFKEAVRAAGFPCTIRQFRGIDVDAGCGQLRAARAARPARERAAGGKTAAAPAQFQPVEGV